MKSYTQKNGLLNRRRGNLAGGSNPPLSAIITKELRPAGKFSARRFFCHSRQLLVNFLAWIIELAALILALGEPRRDRFFLPCAAGNFSAILNSSSCSEFPNCCQNGKSCGTKKPRRSGATRRAFTWRRELPRISRRLPPQRPSWRSQARRAPAFSCRCN